MVRQTTLFRGKIKTLCLTSTLHYRWPKSGDDLEQILKINSRGYVIVYRKISKGWKREKTYDYNKQNIQLLTEEMKLFSGQTVKILNRIRRYFSSTHLGLHVDDSGGEWKLELTNLEGEVFLYYGYVGDYRESLSRTTQLIRNATGMKYIIGFDDNQ